jgi:methylaspartate mutase sigma subunit
MPPISSRGGPRRVVLTTVSSDSHTWNLIFLQLLLEEHGYQVLNLGPCVPDDLLVAECSAERPQLIVVSTVNGHGFHEGVRIGRALRAVPVLDCVPRVIGGKLGISGSQPERYDELLAAGFHVVFGDEPEHLAAFHALLDTAAADTRVCA